jgi:hypothetical protein
VAMSEEAEKLKVQQVGGKSCLDLAIYGSCLPRNRKNKYMSQQQQVAIPLTFSCSNWLLACDWPRGNFAHAQNHQNPHDWVAHHYKLKFTC